MYKIIEGDMKSSFMINLNAAIKEGWKVHTFSTSSTGSSNYCDEPIDDMSTTYIALMEKESDKNFRNEVETIPLIT